MREEHIDINIGMLCALHGAPWYNQYTAEYDIVAVRHACTCDTVVH